MVDWLCRGTLHLVRAEDHGWLHAVTTPGLAVGNARRLAQEGASPAATDRGVAAITRALRDGPRTRAELREPVLRAARAPAPALLHLLFAASLRGLIVRGPMRGREQAFVLREDWLGPAPRVDREAALRELGRRFLAGHGPADERDLAKWAGLPLRDTRAALARAGKAAIVAAFPAQAKLLGAFDPILHGWVDRSPVLGDHEDEVIAGGLFRPFALVKGRAAATWRYERGRVQLEPFGDRPLPKALERDARDVERFLAA